MIEQGRCYNTSVELSKLSLQLNFVFENTKVFSLYILVFPRNDLSIIMWFHKDMSIIIQS